MARLDYVIRPYEERDADAVARCLTSGAALDDALLPIGEEEWRGYARRPFNHGARDFAVAERDGAIAGVLMSTLLEPDGERLRSFRVIVHPHHRRRGIATRMLALVEGQDPGGDTTLRAEVLGKWRVGTQMLERRGFETVERLLWMRTHRPPPDGTPPAGFALRRYRGGEADDAAWRRLNREAYEGTSEYTDLCAAELSSVKREPRFHLWIAEQDGEPVGLCHTKEFSGESYVNSLVVTPRCRGRGLGRALLLAGMRTLREQSPGEIRLNVRADNAHAVALYESVGFVVNDEILELRKRRDPGHGPIEPSPSRHRV